MTVILEFFWFWVAGIFLGGFLSALLLGWVLKWFKNKPQGDQKIDHLEDQLMDYRDQVSHYFLKGSQLMHEFTVNQQKISEHLALGIEKLTDLPVDKQGITHQTTPSSSLSTNRFEAYARYQ